MDKILFTTTRHVKDPQRANQHDAGIDFFMPMIDENLANALLEKNSVNAYSVGQVGTENSYLIIKPHQRVLIPSGVKVWINPKESALIAQNKSGISTKLGLDVLACVVDADYTGEVHISLYNTSETSVTLTYGQKIIQLVHTPVILSTLEKVDQDTYKAEVEKVGTDRGEGGFGSTDKKKKK